MELRRHWGAIALALALPAHAATLTETDFFADLPVVLTVSKMAQPLQDSPSSVTIIDQDMIRASGYQDIPDLLRLVPGFSVAYTRDNYYAVGYHGMADSYSRRFQVLVDGRSIYMPNYGEVGWNRLPLAIEDIERIEVVRGPNASVYGANAFFAIINILSKDPSQTRGKMASVLVGEQNMSGGVFRYGGTDGDLRYRVTLSSQHRDRFEKTYVGFNRVGQDKTEDFYERTYTRFANGRLDYQLSPTDNISAQFGLTGGNWNAGRESDPTEVRSYEPFNGFAQMRFARVLGAEDEWSVQFSHMYDSGGMDSFVAPFIASDRIKGVRYTHTEDVLVRPNVKQWRTQLDFNATRRLGPELRLALGSELRHEAVEGRGMYGTQDKQDGVLGNIFANVEWQARKDWLVQGGAQLGYHYFTGLEVSPRLAISYQLNPRHTLRWAASRATRSPTFFEENGNAAFYNAAGVLIDQQVVPSAGLDPEINTSTEIGYLGHWPEWGAQLDVRLYRDHVTDYIGWRADKQVLPLTTDQPPNKLLPFRDKYFQYVNGGTVDVTGLDLQLIWKPHRDVSFHLAQSFVDIDTSHDTVDDDIPKTSPNWISSLLAIWRISPGLNLSAMLYRTDSMKWLGEGDRTDLYTRADFRLARQFKLDGLDAEWALGVQNAGDDYEEFRPVNVFSRRAYTMLRLDW